MLLLLQSTPIFPPSKCLFSSHLHYTLHANFSSLHIPLSLSSRLSHLLPHSVPPFYCSFITLLHPISRCSYSLVVLPTRTSSPAGAGRHQPANDGHLSGHREIVAPPVFTAPAHTDKKGRKCSQSALHFTPKNKLSHPVGRVTENSSLKHLIVLMGRKGIGTIS